MSLIVTESKDAERDHNDVPAIMQSLERSVNTEPPSDRVEAVETTTTLEVETNEDAVNTDTQPKNNTECLVSPTAGD